MNGSTRTFSENVIMYLLLMVIAILLVAIYTDYSANMFNEFEYAMNKTLGNFDAALAGR